MPQGKATRRPVQVDYFHLATTADLTPCMEGLLGLNYESTLKMAKQADGSAVTLLSIEGPPPERQKLTATLGSVLVWQASKLHVMTLAQFQAAYTVP
jgi:hypothetical protein